ncbi:uncharacterized protein LOC112906275 [Agrilus planipennis]|uniref:Uncharacterized protein LOC112906275 n=1 Tax=Agrilus planipennis TaxID=224129 RepID=A0A7F5RJ96_AGRPL|nr:uncharacterized protein LOC112906275 [Agrilus planipennis]
MTESCITEGYLEAPCSLSQRVALFNKISNSHQEKQAVNPFSQDKSVNQLQKRRFSKEEYGR